MRAAVTCCVLLACAAVVVTARDWQDDCVFTTLGAGHATAAECSFKSLETHIRLQGPSPIVSLRVRGVKPGGRYLYIDEGTLAYFKHLRSIYITTFDILAVRHNSLLPIKGQNAIAFTVEQVGVVTFEPGALSDLQHPESTIYMKNIGRLSLSKQAMAPNSTFKDVTLENVPALSLEKEAIQSRIGSMKLQNVTLSVCFGSAFSGRIGHLSLDSVSSVTLYAMCIRATPGWKSLSVRSSHLERVEASAIYGAIENVMIESSDLGFVATKGIDLAVSRFSLSSCTIRELSESALQVTANQSISLHSLHVASLGKNALLGLNIARGNGYRWSDDERPQVCLSSLTVDAAVKGALSLHQDSPVSMYGRVCPPEALKVSGRAQCIGEDSPALVSLDVFRSRCCFDAMGSKSPACPTYEWVPYVAAAVSVILLAAVALLCYRRKVRAKRWQLARQAQHPRISIVPSVEGLGSDASDHGSPYRAAPSGSHGGGSEANSTDNVFEEADERGRRAEKGPLESWLQTLRETMPHDLEGGSAETIEMADCGESTEPRMNAEAAAREETSAASGASPEVGDTGSDTESVLHENNERSQNKTSEDCKQSNGCEEQASGSNERTHADVPDTSNHDRGSYPSDENEKARASRPKIKKKPAPVKPPGASSATSSMPSNSEQDMPVYAVSQKQKRHLVPGQAHQLSSSAQELPTRAESSRDISHGGGGGPSRASGAVAKPSKASTLGRKPPELVYAEVFNSLPRVPRGDPGSHQRQRSRVDSAEFYSEVYHTLETDRVRVRGSRAASRKSNDSDDTYDDLGDRLSSQRERMMRLRELTGEGLSLVRCPLYGAEHEMPHVGRRDDHGIVPSHARGSRGRYVYVETSQRDGGDGGSCASARTSYLYAEISDFSSSAGQGREEIPSYATVYKKPRASENRDAHKAGGWSSLNPFSKKHRRNKSEGKQNYWPSD